MAALLARHRLGDRPLALKYALALTERGTGPMVAAWARDMSLGLLRESGKERDAAALARRLLASGRVTAPHEVRYLEREFPHAYSRFRGAVNNRRKDMSDKQGGFTLVEIAVGAGHRGSSSGRHSQGS